MYAFRGAYEARDAKSKIDLRDDSGERVIAARRVAARTAITERMLRREVAHDLESLMNTIALESTLDLRGKDHVRKSVLNFGLPDIGHRTIDEIASNNDVGAEIEAALRQFEPRLIANTIQVSRDNTLDAAELKIRFMVRADLLCEPMNVPVEFVADVELDSGKVMISRL